MSCNTTRSTLLTTQVRWVKCTRATPLHSVLITSCSLGTLFVWFDCAIGSRQELVIVCDFCATPRRCHLSGRMYSPHVSGLRSTLTLNACTGTTGVMEHSESLTVFTEYLLLCISLDFSNFTAADAAMMTFSAFSP